MNPGSERTVLFTGHAPVHFVCFRPLYERLVKLPGFRVFVSGGIRTKTETGHLYDEDAMYDPFGLPKERILPVEEIRERDFDVILAANTKMIAPRKAAARVQIFHGISFRNRAVRKENLGCDFYFFVGPYMHRKFVEAELFTEDDPRALRIGFPKTDRLVNGELNRQDLLTQYEFDGSRPVILYAPTGEKYNSLETMGEEVIRRLAESGRYDLLVKPHDHPKDQSIDWLSKLAVFEDAHTRVVRDSDVTPLLFLADLLLTDASSVSSEYSLLNRPMVFLDVPNLIVKSMQREGSMVDMDTWGRHTGVVVKKPDRITEVVDRSLANPSQHSDVRRAMAKDLFYNPGSATDEAIAWMSRTFVAAAASAPGV